MSNISITNGIRKVIFENFNDADLNFNNDQIFEILKQHELIDQSLTIDAMEVHFKELCDTEILRNIAQNFTTQWFKLFEPIEKIQCNSVKKKVILYRLRIGSVKILVVVLLFSFVFFRRLLKSLNHW